MNRANTILSAVLVGVIAAIFGAGIMYRLAPGRPVSPPAAPAAAPADPIAAIGESYGNKMLEVYSAAWRDGARRLEGGASMEAAVNQVGTSWTTGRTELYDATIRPVLSQVIPEGTPEAEITPKQRAAAAAAFRSIAIGLTK